MNPVNSPLADKFIKGAKLAMHRLVERTKREGGQLVFSKHGKIVRVDARDIKVDNFILK